MLGPLWIPQLPKRIRRSRSVLSIQRAERRAFFSMWQFFISSWRSGLRSRSIQGILLLGVCLVALAFLSASFSPRQPKTVAMDVGFSGIRMSLVMLGLVWVQELIAREMDRRTILFSLTYPVERGSYLLGRFLGVLVLLALACCTLGLFLLAAVTLAGGEYQQGFPVLTGFPYVVALVGVWMDAAIVAAFAMVLSTFATVSFLPLILGLVFAIAGKTMGAVIDYMKNGADGDQALLATYAPLIDIIKWILPDLSRFDLRVWPMYGIAPDLDLMFWALAQFFGYFLSMLAIAIIVIQRRELTA